MARCKCIDARAHSPCRSICMRLHTFPPRPCAWPSVGKTCLPCRAQGSQLARAQRDTLHLRCDPRKRGGEQFAVDDEKQHDRHTVRSGDGKDGVALLQCSPLPSFALPREEEGRRKVPTKVPDFPFSGELRVARAQTRTKGTGRASRGHHVTCVDCLTADTVARVHAYRFSSAFHVAVCVCSRPLTIDVRGSMRLLPHGGCNAGLAVHVGTRRTGPAGSWRLGQPTFAHVVQRRHGRCKPRTDDECAARCIDGRAHPHCDDIGRGCVVLGQWCLRTTGHWRPRATHSSNAAEPGPLCVCCSDSGRQRRRPHSPRHGYRWCFRAMRLRCLWPRARIIACWSRRTKPSLPGATARQDSSVMEISCRD